MLPDLSDRYVISPDPGQFFLKLRLPEDVYCDQCILQVRPFDKGMWQSLAPPLFTRVDLRCMLCPRVDRTRHAAREWSGLC